MKDERFLELEAWIISSLKIHFFVEKKFVMSMALCRSHDKLSAGEVGFYSEEGGLKARCTPLTWVEKFRE